MKKFLAVALALAAIVSFNSCKKCYNCTKQEYQYCATLDVNSPFGANTFTQCFSDSNQRNGFISTVEAGAGQIPGASVSSTTSDTLLNDLRQEVCGSNKNTNENLVLLWEEQGYTCTEK